MIEMVIFERVSGRGGPVSCERGGYISGTDSMKAWGL